MDGDWGLDAEDYIASICAGAIDPYGRTAAELEDELAAFDRDWRERLAALTPDELEAVVEGRMQVPPLPGPAESERAAWLRREEQFTGQIKALQAQRARLEARERELLAGRFQRVRDEGGEVVTALKEAASILAAELRQSDRGIEQRMATAWQIVTELPAAHEAHKTGRISAGHLRVIEQATHPLRIDVDADPAERARVERELVAIAETTTPARLRSRSKRIVDQALTQPLQQRHRVAMERRDVWMVDAGDGMVDIGARVPAVVGAGIFDRLTQAARGKPKDDPRTWDQFRADAFCELLLTGQTPDDLHATNALTATIAITIPATELLRDTDDADEPQLRFPALLDGRVLVDAATVRALAADTATWERLFTHPVTGLPVTVDTYTPNRAQRRWLRARDGRCRWPGCDNPVNRADLDHTIDHASGGPTSIENLAHLCRRHHTMKHATRWSVRQLPDGVLEWTTPLGRAIRDEPESQGPRFAEADAPWGTLPDDGAPPGEAPPEWAHPPDLVPAVPLPSPAPGRSI
ncbi:HNH endonuclease signature motif containing protein [Agrococcus sediminis]|uniref:HNH endonuclease signature motif containing protein n=1 Tax=Agrococcus sediminis TaxID=2599924 RepID=UPI00342ABD51